MTETMVTGIMTASVTGAGLVIAFYALLAAMSDRIFERRVQKLHEKHEEVKSIQSESHAFESSNFGATSKRMSSLNDEIEEIQSFPKYLGPFITADFLLFILSASFAFYWLVTSGADRTVLWGNLVVFAFIGSLALLVLSGVSGITEVYKTIHDRFEELKKQKEHAQAEIREAIKGPVPHPT